MAKNPQPPSFSPAPPPATLDALRDAVGFVADGRPVSQQFIDTLERMLSDLQERTDMVKLVVDHHQMERLLTLLERVSRVEKHIFANRDPEKSLEKQLDALKPKELNQLLALLYREIGGLTKHLIDNSTKAIPTSAPNAIQEAAEPHSPEQEHVHQLSTGLPQEGRERIRDVLNNLKQRAAIEMKPDAPPDEEAEPEPEPETTTKK